MAISVVRVAGTSGTVGTAPNTFTFAVDATGGDCLVVCVGIGDGGGDGDTVSGVTYNGVSLTEIASQADTTYSAGDSWLGRLLSPASGTNNLVVTCAQAASTIEIGVAVLSGVDQTTPTGTPVTAQGQNTTPSINVTGTATSDLVIDVFSAGSGFTARGAGQTGIMSSPNGWLNVNTSSAGGNGAASYESGNGGTVTMSWTITSDKWQGCAVAFKAAAGAAPKSFVSDQLAHMRPLLVR